MSEAILETHSISQFDSLDELLKLDGNRAIPSTLQSLITKLQPNSGEEKILFKKILEKSQETVNYLAMKTEHQSFSEKPEEWYPAFSALQKEYTEEENFLFLYDTVFKTFGSLHDHECIIEKISASQPYKRENLKCSNDVSLLIQEKIIIQRLKTKKRNHKKFSLVKNPKENQLKVTAGSTKLSPKTGPSQIQTVKVSNPHRNELGKHMSPKNLDKEKKEYLLQCQAFIISDSEKLKNGEKLYFEELLQFYLENKEEILKLSNSTPVEKTNRSFWGKLKDKVFGFFSYVKNKLSSLWGFIKRFFGNCFELSGAEYGKNIALESVEHVVKHNAEHGKDVVLDTVKESITHLGIKMGLEKHTVEHLFSFFGGEIFKIAVNFLLTFYKKLFVKKALIYVNIPLIIGMLLGGALKHYIGGIIGEKALNLMIGGGVATYELLEKLTEHEDNNTENSGENDHESIGHKAKLSQI